MLKRLRSILFLAATWALAFAPAGLISGLYRLPTLPTAIADRGATFIVGHVLISMAYGAVCGAVFGLVLATRGRRLATERQLSASWWVRWGALSAAALPLLGLTARAFAVGSVPLLPSLLVVGMSAFTGALGGAATGALSRDPVSRRSLTDASVDAYALPAPPRDSGL